VAEEPAIRRTDRQRVPDGRHLPPAESIEYLQPRSVGPRVAKAWQRRPCQQPVENRAKPINQCSERICLVGARGLEPLTSCV
jgi:hypothetical protein